MFGCFCIGKFSVSESVTFLEFSRDNKFLFSGGGDNLIKQISISQLKVIWVFEFHTLPTVSIISMKTSPRIISISNQEILVINYRSKLLEFYDISANSNWSVASISLTQKRLYLYNPSTHYLSSMDLGIIFDHRISKDSQTLIDLDRLDNFCLNEATGALLAVSGNKLRILKQEKSQEKYKLFKEIKFPCKFLV